MAVYKRNYRRYEGLLTPERFRFLILARYAYDQVFASRLFTAFFVLCFGAPLVAAVVIYLHHNLSALRALQLPIEELVRIDATFFLIIMSIQSGFGFVLTSFVGPGLISPDLANNALALYLSRPFSRTEYVLGKMSVLVALWSLITWLPGLLLFALQSSLEGAAWFWDNLRIAGAIVAGSFLWTGVFSLLALSLSAWVKWKPVAGALLFGVFFAAAGFGQAANEILQTKWGYLLDLGETLRTIWVWLFQGADANPRIPVWSACVTVAVVCGVCLLLLNRKIRAYEVVR